MLNPTTIAIPLYFLLIGLELMAAHYQKTKLYRLNDAITNINTGASQQIVAVLMRLIGVNIYAWLYTSPINLQLVGTTFSWLNFIILFIAWDFCYYWAHRMSHEINLMWSGHVVHHQSEDYNLSVALRQSWFQGIWTAPFYLPLAFVGFRPEDVVYVSGLNLIYQFWIHTEIVGKLGPLEWVFSTPSHHRVHHGRNPEYIDKNHGGVFIIWDRMFGTFQEEKAKPVYGITTPVKSWNPVWVNFAHFKTIGQQLSEARSWQDKLKVLFYKPGWSAKMAAYLPIPEVDRQTTPKFVTPTTPGLNAYVLIQYLLAMVGTALLLFQVETLPLLPKVIGCLLVIWYVGSTGALFEYRSWAYALELTRLWVSVGAVSYLLYTQPLIVWLMPAMVALALGSSLWLLYLRRQAAGQLELLGVKYPMLK
ncbi:sterol desaturase family protein [Eisenibacter elegans]|jgi:sterol desaturase/sphingolipid hydroxylase (fatty acid hydroxylase superfamily)|uniref:sterol desaturase family protein n=1 Tax=Eisenibacter elegans TaxID=997 RepID=UPI000552B5CD|nr:sterol desaturase family protein [Eisenibacter elegans]